MTKSRSTGELSHNHMVARALLRLMSWSLSYYERVKLFRNAVAAERKSIQGNDDINAGTRSRVICETA